MQQHHNHNAEPVASEPRLFVGQVPTDKTAEDLAPLFEPFGVIKNLHLVKGPDGKSRGCAMVLYEKWSQAEAAMEAHDGKTVLEGGKNRPLVVHFANPRKANPAGLPPEQGVAPKKVFVGQVSLHYAAAITNLWLGSTYMQLVQISDALCTLHTWLLLHVQIWLLLLCSACISRSCWFCVATDTAVFVGILAASRHPCTVVDGKLFHFTDCQSCSVSMCVTYTRKQLLLFLLVVFST